MKDSPEANGTGSGGGVSGGEKSGSGSADGGNSNGNGNSGNGNGSGTGGGAGRRTSDGQGGKVKRVAACDVCRLRKVKCVKEDGEIRCQGCIDLNRECSYTYMPKKPGPPNPYARPAGSFPSNQSQPDSHPRYAPYPSPSTRPSFATANSNGPGPRSPTSAATTLSNFPFLPDHAFPTPPIPGPSAPHVTPPYPFPTPPLGGYGHPGLPPKFGGPGRYGHGGEQPIHLPPPGQHHPPNSSGLGTTGTGSGQATAQGPGQHSPSTSNSEFSPNQFGRQGSAAKVSATLPGDITLGGVIGAAGLVLPTGFPEDFRPHLNGHLSGDGAGQGTNHAQNFLSGYSAEDNWFMPWVCSTPGADGGPPAGYGTGHGGEASGSARMGTNPLAGPSSGESLTGALAGVGELGLTGTGNGWDTDMEGLDSSLLGDAGLGPGAGAGTGAGTGPRGSTDDLGLDLGMVGGGSRHYGNSFQPATDRNFAAGGASAAASGGRSQPLGSGPASTNSGAQSFTRPSPHPSFDGGRKGPSGADTAAADYASSGGPAGGSGRPGGMAHRNSQVTSVGPDSSIYLTQIEDITPWSTALTFLSLYHEHLYPLLPLMHWPSFSQLLVSRHDRHDEVFRIFLMSLIAYSILQLPRSVIPASMSQQELVKLHQRCHNTSRAMQRRVYEPLELTHISTLYCDHIYLGSTGKDNAANVLLAEAMRLAIALGLHDESIAEQQGLDAIEKETRRRVFWVLYGSDRTIAALISCPMLLSDEDIFVSDILEVDDSLITAAGAFQQPARKTPVLSGFVHVTRIFRLLSSVLRLVRNRAHGQSVADISADLSPDPRELIRRLQDLLDNLPPPLRIQSDVQENRSSSEINAFNTCKANILVTQVLVRFAIYQYATLRAQGRPDQCLDELTEDVLKRLHQMSSESLAANGESIRHKVLFIASSLLNKYPAQDSAGHEHVADFLKVYNKILTNQTKGDLDGEEEEETDDMVDEPALRRI